MKVKWLIICMAVCPIFAASSAMAADLAVFSRDKMPEVSMLGGIQVIAKMDDKAVAVIAPEQFSNLKGIDPSAVIIETQTNIDYLWIAGGPNLPMTSLYKTMNYSLIKLSFDEAQRLMASGVHLAKCLLMNLPPDKPHSQLVLPPQGRIASDLDSLLALVSVDSVRSYIQRLEDFRTRYSNTDSFWASADWITSKFETWGYDNIDRQEFSIWDIHSCNIIAAKIGSVYPDKVIVIGGHFDSVVYDGGDPNQYAPGADDNGSGTAMVMEIARVLASIPFKKTVKFIAFGAEEQGLFGSEEYVRDALERGENIELMINADMIGNLADDYLNFAVKVNENGLPYGRLLAELSLDNTTLIPDIQLGEFNGSDHYPFDQAGFRTVYSEEGDFSPNWHMQSDVIANMNIEYLSDIARSNLGLLVLSVGMPTPVTGLQALNAGDGHTAYLSWVQANDPDVIGYEIYRGNTQNSLILADSSSVAFDTLRGIPENTQQYYAVTAITSDGASSLIEELVPLTLRSIPTRPDTLAIIPNPGQLQICWTRTPDLDFAYYQVYRRVGDSGDFSPYARVTGDTMLIDNGLQSNMRYYYNVASIDTTALFSQVSHTDYAKIISLDSGILLVDETRDGNGTPGQPTDAEQDSFYAYISRQYQTTFHDIVNEGNLRINDLGPYSAIAWMDEDIYNHNLAYFANALSQYLGFGGNLLIVGWRQFFSYGSIRPYTFEPGTFPHDYLHIDTINSRTSRDFIGAQGLDGWPNLAVLPERVLPAWNGVLLGVDVMSLRDSTSIIYTYNSSSGDTLVQDRPTGITVDGGTYKCVDLTFPLWTMPTDSAAMVFGMAMDYLGQETSVSDDNDGNIQLPGMVLMPNYPNPFNAATTIKYYLANPGKVEVRLYNIMGQEVVSFLREWQTAGWHQVVWNADNLTSGVYFVRLSLDEKSTSRRALLIK